MNKFSTALNPLFAATFENLCERYFKWNETCAFGMADGCAGRCSCGWPVLSDVKKCDYLPDFCKCLITNDCDEELSQSWTQGASVVLLGYLSPALRLPLSGADGRCVPWCK